jgi:hypothetical protein
MYFDPLEFPLLDETLIPPLPKDQPPQDENVEAEGPVEDQVEAEPSSDESSQSGDAQVGDNQQPRNDRNDEAANDYEQESEEAAPVETYDALCDPSLPIYLPRNSCGDVDFSHHRRRCLVCRHAYRAVIEHDYLSWRDPADIARDCGFRDARPILRHAEATGLDRHRASRITSALERLIYKASSATPSAGSIVSAIKLYAQMTGSWTAPPRQVVVTHVRHVVRKDASYSAPHGVSHNARDGVRDDASSSARADTLPGVNHSVPDGVTHGVAYGARADVRHSARADTLPGASHGVDQGARQGVRQGVGNAAQQCVPHDVHQGVGEGVSHDLRDEARHGVDQEIDQGVRQELRDEVSTDAPAATHSDSAIVRHQGTAATGPDRAGGEAAPVQAVAPAGAAVPHPEFQGGALPSLAPATQISNRLPRRLEIEVSP